MTSSWLSALIGAGLGGGYGLSAYVMNRFALRHARKGFMALFVGSLLLRMAGMLASVGAVLALVSVRPLPFMFALMLFLIGGIALEVRVFHLRA